MNPDAAPAGRSAADRPRAQAPTSLCWVLVAAVLVLVFDPGIMSNDSVQSLKQARAFAFTDWHPPVMAILWSVFDRIVPGPAGMLVAQAVLYSFAAARLCATAFPTLSERTGHWPVVIAFSLFPPAMSIVGMIWKDVWMSGFLMLALSYLFSAARARSPSGAWRPVAMLVACCLAATLFRHNALAATAGLLAGAAYHVLGRMAGFRRLAAACVAGLVMSVLLAGLASAFNRLVAEPAQITTALRLYDIAGIVANSDAPTDAAALALSGPAMLTTDRSRFLDNVLRSYTPASATPVVSPRGRNAPFSVQIYRRHDAEGVARVWTTMIGRYPLAYARHRLRVTACLLQLCDRAAWIQHTYFLNERYAFDASVQPDTIQWAARKVWLSPSLAILYMPAFWFLAALAGGVVGLLRNSPSPLFFMAASALGLLASLVLTSPVESFRYVHWIMLLGWTTCFLLLEHRMSRAPGAARENARGQDAAGIRR